jgi:hypothetical protein
MIPLLDDIVALSERHVTRLPEGWKTDLYSLTKQDYALRDIPGMAQQIRPIHDYICKAIQILYGSRKVVVDKNQPHILKYSVESGHTGGKKKRLKEYKELLFHGLLMSVQLLFLLVELHHDRCDVTSNLALSKSHEYKGGG